MGGRLQEPTEETHHSVQLGGAPGELAHELDLDMGHRSSKQKARALYSGQQGWWDRARCCEGHFRSSQPSGLPHCPHSSL